MESPSINKILAAYSQYGQDWATFVEWVQKKYPKQKFHLESGPHGSNYQTEHLLAGSSLVAQVSIQTRYRGMSTATEHSVGFYGDNHHITWAANNAPRMPSFADMKTTFEKVVAGAPLLLGKLNAREVTPDYAVQLRIAWAGIGPALKSVVVLPLEVIGGGKLDSADVWVKYNLSDVEGSSPPPLVVVLDYKSRKFEITSFGETFTAGTVPGFITLLGKLPQIIKKGLSTLPAHEAAALVGKMTSENVVSRVLDVKARFSVIDEWHDTNLEINLLLTTAKPVSERLLIKWVFDHWTEVLKLAPSKVPAPSTGRGRSDSYDEPSYGLGWIVPNRMPRPTATEMSSTQNGKQAVVYVNATHR